MSKTAASYCMLYITTNSRAEAGTIGRVLVSEKLAACANIIDNVTSIYRWNGKIEEGAEALLIAKTRKDLADTLIARVNELHNNEVPCAVAYEMTAGLAPYLNWIESETEK